MYNARCNLAVSLIKLAIRILPEEWRNRVALHNLMLVIIDPEGEILKQDRAIIDVYKKRIDELSGKGDL